MTVECVVNIINTPDDSHGIGGLFVSVPRIGETITIKSRPHMRYVVQSVRHVGGNESEPPIVVLTVERRP